MGNKHRYPQILGGGGLRYDVVATDILHDSVLLPPDIMHHALGATCLKLVSTFVYSLFMIKGSDYDVL